MHSKSKCAKVYFRSLVPRKWESFFPCEFKWYFTLFAHKLVYVLVFRVKMFAFGVRVTKLTSAFQTSMGSLSTSEQTNRNLFADNCLDGKTFHISTFQQKGERWYTNWNMKKDSIFKSSRSFHPLLLPQKPKARQFESMKIACTNSSSSKYQVRDKPVLNVSNHLTKTM